MERGESKAIVLHPGLAPPAAAAGRGPRGEMAGSPGTEGEGAPLLGRGGGGGGRPLGRLLGVLKGLYFLNALSASAWGRFATVYYNLKGLNPKQIGYIETAMPLVTVLCMPVWGLVSDRAAGRKREIFMLTSFLNVAVLLLLALPRLSSSFDSIMTISAVSSAFSNTGLIDAIVLDLVGDHARQLWGQIRLWGALSWGLGAGTMGFICDATGSFDWNFILFGVFSLAGLALTAFCVPNKAGGDEDGGGAEAAADGEEGAASASRRGALDPEGKAGAAESGLRDWARSFGEDGEAYPGQPMQPPPPQQAYPGQPMQPPPPQQQAYGEHEAAAARRGPFSPTMVLFLLEQTFAGAGIGAIERLVFIYLVNDLKGSVTLCGLSVLVSVLPELPIFHFSEWFLNTLGFHGCFALSYGFYSLRTYLYTLLQPSTVGWFLAIEILHGFTFALYMIASVEYSRVITPPGWSSTVQTLRQVCYNQLGCGVGALAGGWVMFYYGSRCLYDWCSYLTFFFFAAHGVLAWRGGEAGGGGHIKRNCCWCWAGWWHLTVAGDIAW